MFSLPAMPPDDEFASPMFSSSDPPALTAQVPHSIYPPFPKHVFRLRKSFTGYSTAQTVLEKAEHADAPNTNPAGESDFA